MNLDRTSIAGIIFCIVLYVGYDTYLNKKYPQRRAIPVSTETKDKLINEFQGDPSSESAVTETKKAKETKQNKPQEKQLSYADLSIENSEASYLLDQRIGGFKSIKLNKYLTGDKESKVSLVDNYLGFYGTSSNSFNFHTASYKAERVSPTAVKFSRVEDQWLIEHTIEIDEKSGYGATVDFTWTNLASEARNLNSSVYIFDKVKLNVKKKGGFLPDLSANERQTIAMDIDGKQVWKDVKDFSEAVQKSNSQVTFVGFDSHYFLKGFIPETKENKVHHLLIAKEVAQSSYHSSFLSIKSSLDQGSVAPKESRSFKFKSWTGPKSQEKMTAYSANLTEAIDLGWFSAICHLFFTALAFIYNILGNWGASIIIFTVFLKILLYPMTKASAVSMHRTKKFQPQLNSIKEKYKDNPQRQQQETMKFMRENKVNPFKGCLPVLVTMPVFVACWRTLQSSVELRHAPFFGWIHDLSIADPYYITPILGGALMFLQQKITPTSGMDKTQENMMLIMPLGFSVIMLTMPAGVVLYSLTNTIVSFLQQQWLNKKLAKTMP